MRPILEYYKSSGTSLEESITDKLNHLTRAFGINSIMFNNPRDVVEYARGNLSDEYFTVFNKLFKSRVKQCIKAIRILRKLSNIEYYDRVECLKENTDLSNKEIHFLLGYIDPMIDFSKDDSGNLTENHPSIYFQDWTFSAIDSNINK